MASYAAVFDHGLDDDDHNSSQYDDEEDNVAENEDVLIDDDDEDEDENLDSPPTAINNNSITETATVDGIYIPVHLSATPSPAPSVRTLISLPNGVDSQKRDLIIEAATPIRTAIVQVERKPPAILDDSRKLFQRIWTDEDEIEILKGFLDYTIQRGGGSGSHHHHYDTTVFYDQIKSKLQLDFNKNQLVEKLRRLKKKYRTVVSKIDSGKEFTFKSAHDQATFEISRKIWVDLGSKNGGVSSAAVDDNVLEDEEANNVITNINLCNVEVKSEDFGSKPRPRKRARSTFDNGMDDKLNLNETFVANNITSSNENVSGNGNGNGSAGVVAIEETVKSCLAPLFKDLLSAYKGRGLGGLTMNNPMLLSFGMPAVDERWRKQQILELEVYSKRLELVQDQIKTSLEELRSMGG